MISTRHLETCFASLWSLIGREPDPDTRRLRSPRARLSRVSVSALARRWGTRLGDLGLSRVAATLARRGLYFIIAVRYEYSFFSRLPRTVCTHKFTVCMYPVRRVSPPLSPARHHHRGLSTSTLSAGRRRHLPAPVVHPVLLSPILPSAPPLRPRRRHKRPRLLASPTRTQPAPSPR